MQRLFRDQRREDVFQQFRGHRLGQMQIEPGLRRPPLVLRLAVTRDRDELRAPVGFPRANEARHFIAVGGESWRNSMD